MKMINGLTVNDSADLDDCELLAQLPEERDFDVCDNCNRAFFYRDCALLREDTK